MHGVDEQRAVDRAICDATIRALPEGCGRAELAIVLDDAYRIASIAIRTEGAPAPIDDAVRAAALSLADLHRRSGSALRSATYALFIEAGRWRYGADFVYREG